MLTLNPIQTDWRQVVRSTLFALTCLMVIGRSGAETPFPYRHAIDDPLRRQKSYVFEETPDAVYDVYGEYVIRGTRIHNASLKAIFNTGIKKLAGCDDPNQAWRSFIHDDDVVALKFTSVGSDPLGTNRAFAAALLQCLYQAGFKPDHFMLVGLDDLPDEAKGTRPCRYGWQQKKTDFGSDSDYLAQWLDDVTAVINIPSIMDDNIIGLHGALANLTWPMIKSPARFYQYNSRGDPFIPEIFNLPQIRGKVRLHIANALRILYYGGPIVRQHFVYEYGAVLFSLDPVAMDLAAMKIINRIRRDNFMPANVPDNISVTYLQTAQDLGLGYCDLNFIDYQHIPHEKWTAK
jgi:hypothetical protein